MFCFGFLFLFSDRYVIIGSHHSSLKGYGGQGWASSTAVITALLQALMAKVKRGWRPDRTLLFCSWGGTALGNVGSYEWAEVKLPRGFLPLEAWKQCEMITWKLWLINWSLRSVCVHSCTTHQIQGKHPLKPFLGIMRWQDAAVAVEAAYTAPLGADFPP